MKIQTLVVLCALIILYNTPAHSASAYENKAIESSSIVGVYDTPPEATLNKPFFVYLIVNNSVNATLSFYPLISSNLPYICSTDEVKKGGFTAEDIKRIKEISMKHSNSWSVYPKEVNLKDISHIFKLKITLRYTGYWDMLIIVHLHNGSSEYIYFTLTKVVGEYANIYIYIYSYIAVVSSLLIGINAIRRRIF